MFTYENVYDFMIGWYNQLKQNKFYTKEQMANMVGYKLVNTIDPTVTLSDGRRLYTEEQYKFFKELKRRCQ